MVESVDTPDLKSCGLYGPCGFDSRSWYKEFRMPRCYDRSGAFFVVMKSELSSGILDPWPIAAAGATPSRLVPVPADTRAP